MLMLPLLVSCAQLEPALIRIPDHFRLLGDELVVEMGEVSGPIALYRVSWRGERLLPLGHSLWSGEINARNGPGVRLLISLYPAGEIPRDLNCELIIDRLAGMEERWLIEAAWLDEALFSDSLDRLADWLPAPIVRPVDFGGDSWISTDPLDGELYAGTARLVLYPGEIRSYIGLNTKQLRIVHLTEKKELIVVDRDVSSSSVRTIP